MFLRSLIVEATRKCNYECDHCLRGDTEQVDMPISIFAQSLKALDVTEIGTLTISGGEPLLRPSFIDEVVDVLKLHNVEVQNFYIATNGSQTTDKVVQALFKLWMYCIDNEESQLHISDDKYHRYERGDREENRHKRLFAFAFTSYKEDPGENDSWVIQEGRGGWGGNNHRIVKNTMFDDYEDLADWACDVDIYVNVHGWIFSECDFSYESQEEKGLFNVSKDTIESYYEDHKEE